MAEAQELEVIDQLLDSSRKLNRYVEELPEEYRDLALTIKRKFNQLLDKAIEVYFHSEEKATDLAAVLLEVQEMLDNKAEPEVIYEKLVA